jgi:hypothetical protein
MNMTPEDAVGKALSGRSVAVAMIFVWETSVVLCRVVYSHWSGEPGIAPLYFGPFVGS